MIKHIRRILLVALALLLVAGVALATPRLPQKQGVVTDAAAVLAHDTVTDLTDYADRLRRETGVELLVVTVDFLDGSNIDAYAALLIDQWHLSDDHLLLLLAVGEDNYGLFAGEDVEKRLTPQVRQKLLSSCLAMPFLAQQYDEAITAFIPALNTELGKVYNEDIDLDGLFGTVSVTAPPFRWAEEWMDRNDDDDKHERTLRQVVTGEDKSTGFSLGKVILTVLLLMVIFGKRKDGKRGCGCGCMPFSSLLAGWGLWKLWKKN